MQGNSIKLRTHGLKDIYKLYTILVSNDVNATASKGYRVVNVKSLLGLVSLEPDKGFELEISPNENIEDIHKILVDFLE